jgi:hypothetical protein
MRRRHLLVRSLLLGALPAGSQPVASTPAGTVNDEGGPLPAPGSRITLPSVALFDGTRFEPAQAAGQVVVLYWWASWCPFCAMQSPYMDKLWLQQRHRGLQMLALSIDKRADDAKAYLARKNYSFPAGWFTPEAARVLPKPKGLPVTVVLDRNGKVVMSEAGQLFPEDVEQIARWL